ncbi:PHP domain-containing protein, partial [Leucobacter sp. M11]|uniref:PHP domain-containing protein n=1 Tax=Leucobacter sp. M11 TaxID=2993565 RepID=UPI002D7EC404
MSLPSFVRGYDLHTHSAISDGTTSPAEIAAEVAELGLTGFALTDHDTVDGWDEARTAAAGLGVDFIPGLELTTKTNGISVHLLAYGIDPEVPELAEIMARIRESRYGRAREMVRRLSKRYPLDWDTMSESIGVGVTLGRPHIADALVQLGHFPDRGAAFADVLHPGGPYYVNTYAVETVTGIELVRAAGGVPVLAHPAARRQRGPVPVPIVEDFAAAGLWGIELDHPENRPDWTDPLRPHAARL